MTDVPNQRDWRKVFQDTASDLKVEAAIAAAAEITVKQAVAANLKAEVTLAALSEIIVKQATAANLEALVTLKGLRGIVPNPIDATREFLYNSVSGVGNNIIYTIAADTKFFLDAAWISVMSGANAGAGILALWTSVPAESTFILNVELPSSNMQNSFSISYHRGAEISAGFTIRIRTNAVGVIAYAGISGWVESTL